jgi:ubiquinone/menaquinone biosynthesis C-methylase UbiE
MDMRAKVVPLAEGEVLEVGMGSALNLPMYDTSRVSKVWGLEPSSGMRKKAEPNLKKSPVQVEWLDLPGEEIPLDDNSVDSVLLTYTLCTIPDWDKALQQMQRVLKPGGKLLFCEHGLAPDPAVSRWQNRLTPLWKKLCGGCHLNRNITEGIERNGFRLQDSRTLYMDKTPKFAGHMYYGSAKPD